MRLEKRPIGVFFCYIRSNWLFAIHFENESVNEIDEHGVIRIFNRVANRSNLTMFVRHKGYALIILP